MKRLFLLASLAAAVSVRADDPNIVFVLADDIGFGDVSCYGATAIQTPNLDRLADRGLRFTDAHCPSGTCTPTRYALLTGEYAWRRKGTGILPGDAAMIIRPERFTLPRMLKAAGYATACVGKWHLGLGDGNLDWNQPIAPGPKEIGFDYSFILPATGDRVPCVYLENGRVVGLDPADPLSVSYGKPIGNEPTGRSHPELLTLKWAHGHDDTIVNGISRIGYMSGGKAARWDDETMADEFARRAVDFIQRSKDQPFFLYFASHDIHVPRVPHPRFRGKSTLGVRGDALLQFDDTVGQLVHALEAQGKLSNTLFIVSSDNGPVLDDGYADGAYRDNGNHRPAGPFRGTKYSLYEAATRVPFIVHWPARIKGGRAPDGLFGFIDLFASLAALTGTPVPEGAAPDSMNALAYLIGESDEPIREDLVVHDGGNGIALRSGPWKFIPAGPKNQKAQLYDLDQDPGETTNMIESKPAKAAELSARLSAIRTSVRVQDR